MREREREKTISSQVRAASQLSHLGVDIANLSYGEEGIYPFSSRFAELVEKNAVNEKGVIFVTSAGNSGPTLSYEGCPSMLGK
jgi:tripeptidyl-peptidase-2